MPNPISSLAVVVDDNPIVLMNACQIIEDAGFDCQNARTGDEAWDMIHTSQLPVTLLFSDIDMPGSMSGLDLARRVSAAYPGIEVVLASGMTAPGTDELPGNTTFISKPFSAAVVHDHLRAKLPASKTPGPLRAAV